MTDSEVDAVAQALLDAARAKNFWMPIPLDQCTGPDQYRREAQIAIEVLDAYRAANDA